MFGAYRNIGQRDTRENFPCFLRFQGGKGVATTIGVLLGTMPAIAGLVGVVWLAVFAACRYVSIASMVAAVAIPVGQTWAGQGRVEVALGCLLAGLILLRHRANLDRLRRGTEPRALTRPAGHEAGGGSPRG